MSPATAETFFTEILVTANLRTSPTKQEYGPPDIAPAQPGETMIATALSTYSCHAIFR